MFAEGIFRFRGRLCGVRFKQAARGGGTRGWSTLRPLSFRRTYQDQSRTGGRGTPDARGAFPKQFKYVFAAKLRVPRSFVEDGRGAWVEYDPGELDADSYEEKEDGLVSRRSGFEIWWRGRR